MSGKAATSGAGKGLIKEELGKNGVRVIDIMKEIITLYEGKKKVPPLSPLPVLFYFFLFSMPRREPRLWRM